MIYKFSILFPFFLSWLTFSSDFGSSSSDSDDEWIRYDSGIMSSGRNLTIQPYPLEAIIKFDVEENMTVIIVPDQITESYIKKIKLTKNE